MSGMNVSAPKMFSTKQFQKNEIAFSKMPSTLDSITNEEWDLSIWTLIASDKCIYDFLKYNDASRVVTLDLTNADKISDDALHFISLSFPRLEHLSLENAYLVTEKGIKEILLRSASLTTLNISGCLGVSGTGISLLGQHANKITRLNLSGCNQITSWAFTKIFQGCMVLEDLDISFCSEITDHEIKVLSDCCQCLKHLNLKNCVQISDVGMVSLKNVPSLISINMARDDLVLRITDVSILAVSEGCNNLQSLILSGCKMITDVGLCWIAKGCKNLQNLNISGCCKISNQGLRYISEECHDLRNIILTNVKKVSDVGIRLLACGCPKLQQIHGSGLFLLTDCGNRSFSLEGIQYLGSSLASKSLRKLNLHGCFHIGTSSLKAIAMMEQLEVLILSGCTRLTCEGILKVAESCKYISHLSLASCGECITNEMIHEMSPHMTSLKSIDLSCCALIGRKALQGLSKCSLLISVNLSGCTSVTNEAILSLGEGSFQYGMQDLNLSRCNKLDDTALVWITNSFQAMNEEAGYVSLVTLLLSGTKISLKAAHAVSDCFVYSTLKHSKNFFGFIALHRFNDRKAINLFGRRTKSAIKIQSLIRTFQSRHLAIQVKYRSKSNRSAIKIQSTCRVYLSRVLVHRMRCNHFLMNTMAIRLQTFMRAIVAKIKLQKLKQNMLRMMSPIQATKIQKVYRGWVRRKLTVKLLKDREHFHKVRIACSIKVQSLIRRHLARKKMRFQLVKKIALERKLNEASLRIQCWYRCILAFDVLSIKRLQQNRILQLKRRAAERLKKNLRCFQFNIQVNNAILHKRWIHSKSTKIQCWYRSKLALKELQKRKSRREELCKLSSSIRIQCMVRKRISTTQLCVLRRQHLVLIQLQDESALIITSFVRKIVAIKECDRRRQVRRVLMEKIFALQTLSATQIAAVYRGYKGRLIQKQLQKEKKSRWKEMWSHEDDCPFYYNQVTGESRWKKPQELLDLEPRPECSNCGFYEARFECKDCGEFFCMTCFKAVHFGGKRKYHLFRVLYDYYNKRLGYDSDEFPSIWPDEFKDLSS